MYSIESKEDVLTSIIGDRMVAKEALAAYGDSLVALERAHDYELRKTRGLGPARIRRMRAAFELGKLRAEEPLMRGEQLLSSRQVFETFSPRFSAFGQEWFVALLLDPRNRLIKAETVSIGSFSSAAVMPANIFREALRVGAVSVILMHNHPSGDPTPSMEDLALTSRAVEGGQLLGIRVLDHIILGQGRFTSMAETGMMEKKP